MKSILNKIKNYITTMGWLGLPASFMRLDLQLHGLVGLWLVPWFYMIPHFQLGFSKGLAFLTATAASFIIAFAKEYRDSKQPNNKFDWLDLITTVGFTIAFSLWMVIFR